MKTTKKKKKKGWEKAVLSTQGIIGAKCTICGKEWKGYPSRDELDRDTFAHQVAHEVLDILAVLLKGGPTPPPLTSTNKSKKVMQT